jgi:CRISPR/Cas system CMR subunit Cmr6 (Cas7 group RAMP superfamily)
MWNDYFSALCDHQPDPTSGPLKRWAITQSRNKKILTIEEQEALESIPGWRWLPTWSEQLAALREYVAEHNELPKYAHERLGLWITNQRKRYNKLTPEKKAALENVPGWGWNIHKIKNKYSWDEQLAALREYVAANNELPKRLHERLGTWISTQRKRKDGLTAEKQATLEAIPGWVWKTYEVKNKYSWDEQLATLREYVATNNKLPKTTHERLGVWISTQRVRKDNLTADKQAALEAIPGWVWKMREIKNKHSWDEQLAALREYVAAHNELPKQSHERLGSWISNQRTNKNKLTADKQAVLEAIPGWVWKTHEVTNMYSWDEQLATLREYVATNNKLPKTTHERLGAWISTQRHNKNKLTADKQAALEAVPGWVWKRREIRNRYSWKKQLAALHEYVATNNELPKKSHGRLGVWICTQRINKDRLTYEKKAALEATPGWVWNMREIKNRYSWEEQLASLHEYVAINHELPKHSHGRLGAWISTQRKQYRKQKLSAARIDLLHSIPTWRW